MKLIHVEQSSLEWLVAKAGLPTASEWDALVSPKWEIRKGQMPETYLYQKLAEWWTKGPLPGYMTLDMDSGQILEKEAIPFYILEFNEEVQRIGLATNDDGTLGCSPDGLIGEDGGIEIKCPMAKTHVGYLMDGEVPPQYLAQIHGSMLVTGRQWWKFFSYRRHFPPLIKHVERDEKIQAVLREALDAFLAKFDAGKKYLIDLNGGERKEERIPFTPRQAAEAPFDLIP